jgi:mRNA-degrading endonuclease toxin of MazEF toxin-antitoxin module
VIVAEITRTIRRIPQEVAVGPSEGLREPSVANFDNVHVIPKAAIGDLIGAIAPAVSARSSERSATVSGGRS